MLGLDFGASTLKWTLMERGSVKQAQELPLPENLTRDSHIGSVQMMGDTLRDSIRQNRVGRKPCAVVLPAENVIVRHLTMPYMTVDQLVLNLPYEFHDFIKDEKKTTFLIMPWSACIRTRKTAPRSWSCWLPLCAGM